MIISGYRTNDDGRIRIFVSWRRNKNRRGIKVQNGKHGIVYIISVALFNYAIFSPHHM